MARYLDENGLALLINNYLKPEDEYSLSSEHPVQNKVLTQTFGNLLSIIDYSKVTGYFHYANAAALPAVNSTGQEEGDFEYNPEKELKVGQRAILDDTQAVMEISAIDSETGAITWINTGLSFGGQVIQVETIPTASAAEEGKIYQYIGETNLSFINGRFYRCVSDGEASPSYNWEEVDFGDSTPHWTGTRAEYEAIKNTLEAGTVVNITDDYDDGLEVVDVIEDGNMNPVTSNAVAGLLDTVEAIPVTTNNNFVRQEANCKKAGRIIILNFRGSMNNVALSTDANNRTPLGSIPAAYAPKSIVSNMIQGWDGVIRKTALTVDTNGNIWSYGEVSTNNQYMWGQVSWIFED